jgi:hypothetical protein
MGWIVANMNQAGVAVVVDSVMVVLFLGYLIGVRRRT